MSHYTAQKKMLVVEDCPTDVILLESMLASAFSMYDIGITSVPRLIDAFQRIDVESFDIILLDLNLMDMDGVASISALHAEAPHTPIIVYSGMEDKTLEAEACICGASNYLVKGRESAASLSDAIDRAISAQPLTLLERQH